MNVKEYLDKIQEGLFNKKRKVGLHVMSSAEKAIERNKIQRAKLLKYRESCKDKKCRDTIDKHLKLGAVIQKRLKASLRKK